MDKDDNNNDDERFGNPVDYYCDDDDEDDKEDELGHGASGSSPLANNQAKMEAIMNGSISPAQAAAKTIHTSADTLPIKAIEWQGLGLAQVNGVASSPPKMRSSL